VFNDSYRKYLNDSFFAIDGNFFPFFLQVIWTFVLQTNTDWEEKLEGVYLVISMWVSCKYLQFNNLKLLIY